MVHIIGYQTTKFGELWNKTLFGLVEEVVTNLLTSLEFNKDELGAIFFANMLGGVLENNLHSGAKIAEIFDLHLPVFRIEGACASGGLAFYSAYQYLKANPQKTVLVIGAEKMTDYSSEKITDALTAAASGEEQAAGITFPGLYALLAQVYLHHYHYSEKVLAAIAVKNHHHGLLNPKGQFHKKISINDVLDSPYIAYPLKLLDCSPITDGAAAVLLTNNKNHLKRVEKSVRILSSIVATDSISLARRSSLLELTATKIAADKVFKEAKIKRKDIQVAEVHDCFTIAEILALEDLGFWKKGEGGKKAVNFSTQLGKSDYLVVNPSGGLKAAGHPIGATGVKQVGEIFLQLINQAGGRQVKGARYGLAHNVGGSGGTAVVSLLGA